MVHTIKMALPETQLEVWSNQGATTTSADAYRRIRTALETEGSPIEGKTVEIYLQGSYANVTNIRGDSDVDVVVQLNSTFQTDLSRLSSEEQAIYRQTYSNATYLWQHFKADVVTALEDYFGLAAVTPGTKSIKVKTGQGRPSDVIPALHFRDYDFHYGRGDLESFTQSFDCRRTDW